MKIIDGAGMLAGPFLDIHLANGCSFIFNLAPLMDRPEYAPILGEDDFILRPKTDGELVFWPDGPRLSLREMVDMLRTENGAIKITRVGKQDEEMLFIDFEDESAVLLKVNLLTDKLEYEALLEDDRILYPHTDGECVFWKNGPRLGAEEMLNMLLSEKPSECGVLSDGR